MAVGSAVEDDPGSPPVSLQVCCFPKGPEAREGIQLPKTYLMTFPIVHADADCLRRCGTPFGQESMLSCIAWWDATGPLWAQDGAIETLSRMHGVEVDAVLRDSEMADWAHRTVRQTRIGNPWPVPQGYLVTGRSSIHLDIGGRALCQHRQAGRGAARLRDPRWWPLCARPWLSATSDARLACEERRRRGGSEAFSLANFGPGPFCGRIAAAGTESSAK